MQFKMALVGAMVVGFVVATAPVFAQPKPPPARPVSNPDPLISKAMEQNAAIALRDAADAIGMVRWDRSKAPPQISYDTVHTYEYVASGIAAEQKVNRVTVGIDFGIQAIRSNVENAEGQRAVTVASGQLTWDESKPGVFLRPGQTSAAERLKLIWIYPPGVIHAAVRAPEKVKVASKGANRELSVALADGTEIKALMNAQNVITNVEMQAGGKVYSGEYSEYKQDVQDMDVMFPTRIIHKIDGKVVTDLTVSEHFANPYVIFPPPKELTQRP